MPDETVRSWEPSYVCTKDVLTKPMQWHEPSRVRVVYDLFHESVPFTFINRAFAVMALCPQHRFQVLTEHPERAARYLNRTRHDRGDTWNVAAGYIEAAAWSLIGEPGCSGLLHTRVWPLPNVWLGTPVEDQAAADERIPHLLRCPAAVRYLSCEPLRGPVDLSRLALGLLCERCGGYGQQPEGCWDGTAYAEPAGICTTCAGRGRLGCVEWVIVGGESGPGARPCNIDWVRSIVLQCADARVPCRVEQLGAKPKIPDDPHGEPTGLPCRRADDGRWYATLKDKKGADMAEWPVDLRVRQWPGVAT